MKITNTTYDALKWIAQIALPAVGTFYFALCSVWGLPYGEQVIGTITAIDVFLGALLGISTSAYNKSDEATDGVLEIDQNNNVVHVQTTRTIDEILTKKVVSLVVDPDARLR